MLSLLAKAALAYAGASVFSLILTAEIIVAAW